MNDNREKLEEELIQRELKFEQEEEKKLQEKWDINHTRKGKENGFIFTEKRSECYKDK